MPHSSWYLHSSILVLITVSRVHTQNTPSRMVAIMTTVYTLSILLLCTASLIHAQPIDTTKITGRREIVHRADFPRDFKWGSATSAYQVILDPDGHARGAGLQFVNPCVGRRGCVCRWPRPEYMGGDRGNARWARSDAVPIFTLRLRKGLHLTNLWLQHSHSHFYCALLHSRFKKSAAFCCSFVPRMRGNQTKLDWSDPYLDKYRCNNVFIYF